MAKLNAFHIGEEPCTALGIIKDPTKTSAVATRRIMNPLKDLLKINGTEIGARTNPARIIQKNGLVTFPPGPLMKTGIATDGMLIAIKTANAIRMIRSTGIFSDDLTPEDTAPLTDGAASIAD